MSNTLHPLVQASTETDIVKFLNLVFPAEWKPLAARIIESGAEFDTQMCKWAPRWSKIPFTVKKGENELEVALKTVMYRVHDCIHQLWGLPVPTDSSFDWRQFYQFKRAQMCGEVAVLILTEFLYGKYLYDTYPELAPYIEKRNAIQMYQEPLKGKSPQEIAARLDGILHKKIQPLWLREHAPSQRFYDDYMPMLEADRVAIDDNWQAMKDEKWLPEGLPNSRYSENLDGLELTLWLIDDFLHIMSTDEHIDYALTDFNRKRRESIILPKNWQ